jgi:NTP pyrophosphatase (non-canonical NTP hydrolase)
MCRVTDYQLAAFNEIWAKFDPNGTQYIRIDDLNKFILALIEEKVELFSALNRENILSDPYMCQLYINNLGLTLFRQYQYYNYHDTLIAICMKYLIYVAQGEADEIFREFHEINKLDPNEEITLEDVVDHLHSISETHDVQMCKKLGQYVKAFK